MTNHNMKKMCYILAAICIGLACLIFVAYSMKAGPQVDAMGQAMFELSTAAAEYEEAVDRFTALSDKPNEAIQVWAKAVVAVENGEGTIAEVEAAQAEIDRADREIEAAQIEANKAGIRAEAARIRAEAAWLDKYESEE